MTRIIVDMNGSKPVIETSSEIGHQIRDDQTEETRREKKRENVPTRATEEVTRRRKREENREKNSSPRDQTTFQSVSSHRLTMDQFGLRKKYFQPGVSPLDKLFGIKDVKSAYDIIASFVTIIILSTIYDYTINHDRFNEDYFFLSNAFRDFHIAFGVWFILMIIICFIFFPINNYIIKSRNEKSSWILNACVKVINWTTFLLLAFLAPIAIKLFNLSAVSRIALISDSIRLIFKLISFLSETKMALVKNQTINGMKNGANNGQKFKIATNGDSDSLVINPPTQSFDTDIDIQIKSNSNMLSFSHFIYFLFVPTLVYRSNYPRTESINKKRLFTLMTEFLACFVITFLAIKRIVIPIFVDIGVSRWTPSEILNKWLVCALIGQVFMFVSLFYGLLHTWMNIFAEILTFADRQFYQDWWNATNPNEFHRKWNSILHDWIYAYVYKPIVIKFSESQNGIKRYQNENENSNVIQTKTGRLIGSVSVLFISGLMHEYIVYISLRIFFPIMFIMYSVMGIIMFLVFNTIKRFNLIVDDFHVSNFNLCFSGTIAWSMFVFIYAGQYFSSLNCTTNDWKPNLFDCISK